MSELRIITQAERRIYNSAQNFLNDLWRKYLKGQNPKRLNELWKSKCDETNAKYAGTKFRIKLDHDAFQKAMNGEHSKSLPFSGDSPKNPGSGDKPDESNFIQLDI